MEAVVRAWLGAICLTPFDTTRVFRYESAAEWDFERMKGKFPFDPYSVLVS